MGKNRWRSEEGGEEKATGWRKQREKKKRRGLIYIRNWHYFGQHHLNVASSS